MKYVFLAIMSFSIGCSVKPSQISGYYISNCQLTDGTPELKLTLKPDGTFSYILPLIDNEINGTYSIYKRRITLNSYCFTEKYMEQIVNEIRARIDPKDSVAKKALTIKTLIGMMPMMKYTTTLNKDVFLYKKGKLWAIDRNGLRPHCWLNKKKH